MLRFKKQNLNELLEGKTITSASKIIGFSRVYISYVFNGRMAIDEDRAKQILVPIVEKSLKLSKDLEEYGIDNMIKHFFYVEMEG